MNLYDILEIKPNSTENEIKKAYHRLAFLYHPDKNNNQDANDKFQKISYAYQILINSNTSWKSVTTGTLSGTVAIRDSSEDLI